MKKIFLNNKYKILELIIIFIITLLFNLICNDLSNDEIWNYGFSYNIASGLIPYKDFNMVITPLFPIIGAIFLNIFGKNLVVFHIFHGIICTSTFYYMKKFVPTAYYIIYAIFLFFSLPNYNVFCILLLYILMKMEDNNSNDYNIGIVLGLTFLTKQNIGIYLCLPSLLIKDIKKILKRGIGFIIPNILIFIYLLFNDSLYEFIDYIFLGVGSFATKNILIEPICFIMIILCFIYLIYQYIKKKDIKIIYLICFQLTVFPLIETYHTMIAIIPTIAYLLNTLKLNKKIITIAFAFFVSITFSLELYKIYQKEYTFPNITEEYKYRSIIYKDDIALKEITNYIQSIEDRLYIISSNAYLYKLEAKIEINKYDLLNNGNLGKNGEIKIIEEIKNDCNNQKCVFLIGIDELQDNPHIQYNKDIIKYIFNNYKKSGIIHKLLIYQNY